MGRWPMESGRKMDMVDRIRKYHGETREIGMRWELYLNLMSYIPYLCEVFLKEISDVV